MNIMQQYPTIKMVDQRGRSYEYMVNIIDSTHLQAAEVGPKRLYYPPEISKWGIALHVKELRYEFIEALQKAGLMNARGSLVVGEEVNEAKVMVAPSISKKAGKRVVSNVLKGERARAKEAMKSRQKGWDEAAIEEPMAKRLGREERQEADRIRQQENESISKEENGMRFIYCEKCKNKMVTTGSYVHGRSYVCNKCANREREADRKVRHRQTQEESILLHPSDMWLDSFDAPLSEMTGNEIEGFLSPDKAQSLKDVLSNSDGGALSVSNLLLAIGNIVPGMKNKVPKNEIAQIAKLAHSSVDEAYKKCKELLQRVLKGVVGSYSNEPAKHFSMESKRESSAPSNPKDREQWHLDKFRKKHKTAMKTSVDRDRKIRDKAQREGSSEWEAKVMENDEQ